MRQIRVVDLCAGLVSAIAGSITWLTMLLVPLPSAYLVYQQARVLWGVPVWVAVVMGGILEALGLGTCDWWATASAYNRNWLEKRRSNERWARRHLAEDGKFVGDLPVNEGLALALVAAYFLAVALTLMGMALGLSAAWLKLLWPALAIVGMITLAQRIQHRQRTPTKETSNETSKGSDKVGQNISKAGRIRRYYRQHPDATVQQCAEAVRMPRSTVGYHVQKLGLGARKRSP